MDNSNILWVDKYAPKKLDDLVLNPDIKKYFKDMVGSGNVINMTLSGPPGIGKSTICRVLCSEMGAEKLFIPCAVKGNVSTAQGELSEFCNAMTFDGSMKVVILDEVDASSATQDSSFQKSLRNIIESAQSDTRFFLNCNYIEKVIDPIKSRCPAINLSFSKKDLLVRIKEILDAEKIGYDRESLKNFIESAFKFYPDIRRIISYLQGSSSSGKLVVSDAGSVATDKQLFLDELVAKTFSSEKILDVRQFYMRNKDKVQDFVTFGSDLFNYVVDKDMVTEDGILKLTDMIFQLNEVIDKEVGLFGMVVALRKYRR